MVSVEARTNKITLTRGDTVRVKFVAKKDGQPYVYQTGDKLNFYCKKKNASGGAEIEKEINTTSGELYLDSETTKNMKSSEYVYDIQLTKANGDVDTIINMAEIKVTNEVG